LDNIITIKAATPARNGLICSFKIYWSRIFSNFLNSVISTRVVKGEK
jgi:hypothetical protein